MSFSCFSYQVMIDIDDHKKITSMSDTKMKNKEQEENGDTNNTSEIHPKYTTYSIRWLILFLFVMYSTSNAFQWTQLVIITNILENYYKVPTLAVSWTSMIFMVTYIPLIFPASWFLQKKVWEKCTRLKHTFNFKDKNGSKRPV